MLDSPRRCPADWDKPSVTAPHLNGCATDDGPSTDVYDADADVVGEEPAEEPVEERADKAAGKGETVANSAALVEDLFNVMLGVELTVV